MSRQARITITMDIPQGEVMSIEDWIRNISMVRETWKLEDIIPLLTHQDSKVSWGIEPVFESIPSCRICGAPYGEPCDAGLHG